jgi:hypothetical protein
MTTGPRSVNDGSLLVGVKATPSGWQCRGVSAFGGVSRNYV